MRPRTRRTLLEGIYHMGRRRFVSDLVNMIFSTYSFFMFNIVYPLTHIFSYILSKLIVSDPFTTKLIHIAIVKEDLIS